MGYSLGVDLGTTFTAAAVDRSDRIEMITLGDRTVVTPSVVYVREDGQVVTGDAAARRAMASPQRIAREFKRRLGDPTPLMLGGSPHSAAALLGYLLRDVVHHVADAEGAAPDRVVLTHPANWGPYRRELFEEVPRLAGLDDGVRTITEPEAAAAYYAVERNLAIGDTVAVYDLGGGTFDATVVRKQSDGIAILGNPEGIERLGGVDFDEAVLAHVDYALDGALGQLDPRDPQAAAALRRLRQDCVEAKETLSVDTETVIPVFLPEHHGEVRLARAEFEDMVRAPIESTIEALRRALHSAHVEPADLTAVVLVGGSSRIPLVSELVSAELGRPIAVDTHPKYAVALGAAAVSTSGALPMSTGGKIVVQPEQTGAPRGTPAPATPPVPGTGAAAVAVAPASTATEPPAESPGGNGSGPPAGDGVARSAAGAPPPPLTKSGKRTNGGSVRRRNTILLAAVAFIVVVGVLLAVGLSTLNRQPARPAASGQPTAVATTPPSTAPPPTTTPPPASLGTPTVAGSIGVAGPHSVSVSPDGKRMLVTSVGASRVTTIDVASGAVLASIFLPQPPQFVAFTPDGRHAYVSCFETNGPNNVIAVLDTATNAIIANIPVGQHPFALATTPDGRQVWVPDHNDGAISVIDTATNTVTATFKVNPNPHSVAFTPDGRVAYIANHESNLVTAIDVVTRNIITTIPVAKSPHSVTLSGDGRLAIAASYDANSAEIIDTATNKVTATIPVGSNPQSVAVAPDLKHAYVVNNTSNNLSVIDLATNQVSATVPVGAGPFAVAVTPDGRTAYVTASDSNAITVLHAAQ